MSTQPSDEVLSVNGQLIDHGVQISVRDHDFEIEFPPEIWAQTPPVIKQVLLENLTFGETHVLPLMLEDFTGNTISYSTPFPVLESFLFRNQLNDMLISAKVDRVEPLDYLRRFYNLDFEFSSHQSTVPDSQSLPRFKNKSKPTAIIPFTFGKESLTTLALCLELGIEPVLVYTQEPSQPYEEEYKRKILKQLADQYQIPTYFVTHGSALMRNGVAFNQKLGTELGWGSQTTLISLLMLPFVFYHQAQYILIGSEFANNEVSWERGWKYYHSCDQTSFWSTQQRNLIRLLTDNQCQVNSSLEAIDEINIFYLLHHRYPQLGKLQFSCTAEIPLAKNSQWCHHCYKCSRMYLFARATGIDPAQIGFTSDILNQEKSFEHYFGQEIKTGCVGELDTAFYSITRKGIKSPYVDQFKKEKMPYLPAWEHYLAEYTRLKDAKNLPVKYRDQLLKIFTQELAAFKVAIEKK